tara:strand:- start:208 stop:501 length:294 start_codon:yes stop_codon:yes gene_type:complete
MLTQHEESVPYFTHSNLTRLNNIAIETKRNRSLDPKFIKNFDSKTLFPVTMSLLHNDVEIRCILNCGDNSAPMVDIPVEEFNKLPVYKVMAPCEGFV